MIVAALAQLYGVCLVLKRGNYKEMHPNRYIALDYQQVHKIQTETLLFLPTLLKYVTLPSDEIISAKNARAWVSMVSYLEK